MFYNLFSIKVKLIIIKLPHNFTKLRNTSIKLYFIDIQELVLDSLALRQIPLVETTSIKTLQTEVPLANITLIEPLAKLVSAILASILFVKE